MKRLMFTIPLLTLFLIALNGCATPQLGPSVRVLPAAGKPFDVFRTEDATCQQWARQQIGMSPQELAQQNTATGAMIGTAVGTGLGALIGSTTGHVGSGAAIGALGGLMFGTASGADEGRLHGREAQYRYDSAYLQCMYSYGNQMMDSGRRYYRRRVMVPAYYQEYSQPAPEYYQEYQPPPPNQPPPPVRQPEPAAPSPGAPLPPKL